jgi:hypothetical protein
MNKTIITTLAALTLATATQAGDHRRRECRSSSHNYIIERQQAGAVSGVPTTRRIIGRREIDVYRDGSMFEKNNYIGSTKR